jgi:hypothetical protein
LRHLFVQRRHGIKNPSTKSKRIGRNVKTGE